MGLYSDNERCSENERYSDNELFPYVHEDEIEDWSGQEIYIKEEYLEFDSGDLVINEKESVMDYLANHYDLTLELIENVSVVKTLGGN